MAASPHMLTACADTRRENGDGARKRGSVVAILEAGHFLDNPASGRVLEKLGFSPTGIIAPRFCLGRGEELPARLYRLKLAATAAPAKATLEDCLAA